MHRNGGREGGRLNKVAHSVASAFVEMLYFELNRLHSDCWILVLTCFGTFISWLFFLFQIWIHMYGCLLISYSVIFHQNEPKCGLWLSCQCDTTLTTHTIFEFMRNCSTSGYLSHIAFMLTLNVCVCSCDGIRELVCERVCIWLVTYVIRFFPTLNDCVVCLYVLSPFNWIGLQ